MSALEGVKDFSALEKRLAEQNHEQDSQDNAEDETAAVPLAPGEQDNPAAECSPKRQGQLEPTVLYTCTVEAVARTHKDLVDATKRESWKSEWLNKYSAGQLKTAQDADKAIALMLMSLQGRFDYFMPPLADRETAVEMPATGGIGATYDLHSLNSDLPLLPRFSPPQVQAALSERLKHELEAQSVIGKNRWLVLAEDPEPGTPAHEAGLKAGDEIVEIDGQSLDGRTLRDAVALTGGSPGSPIQLTLLTAASGKKRIVALTRARIALHVAHVAEFGDIGYIKLDDLTPEHFAAAQMQAAIDSTCGRSAQDSAATCRKSKLILDLRNNPGGEVDETIKTAEQLLMRGSLVTISRRAGDRVITETLTLTGDGIIGSSADASNQSLFKREYALRLPASVQLVVLINGRTASGGEMLAKILQENRRATVVGARSIGKGEGQCTVHLPYGYDLWPVCMTYLVNEKPVNWVGVKPDIEINQTEDSKEDLQLLKAIEVLRHGDLIGSSEKSGFSSSLWQSFRKMFGASSGSEDDTEILRQRQQDHHQAVEETKRFLQAQP